jgi:cell division septation protein DedD
MPTPIWTKVTDEAKTLAGSAEAEAEKLKHWALTGEDKVNEVVDKAQSKGWTLYIVAGVVALFIVIAWLF